ncbi:MAG: glycosyl hydrolase 53 family protein [Paludibacteraceae bacterium]|nr:glycosyl hydrolase 53 family protein [Paludibacteraceae bacterium]
MKNKMFLLILLTALIGCSSNYPGAMDDPEPEAELITVSDLSNELRVSNGVYDLEFYVRGTEGATLVVSVTGGELPVTGLQSAVVLAENVWKRGYVRGIKANGKRLEVSARLLEAGAKYELQTAYLRKVAKARTFVKGGDLSMLTQVERNGGVYKDKDGKAGDCFEICARNGMNVARLRLYNDPGNAANYPSNQMFNGVQNEADILALAKRAKEAGMEIELTFHYSDYWTNGGEQYKPAAWKGLSKAELHEMMYTYTKGFLTKMLVQGTPPRYVSLGNEIQSGILFDRIEEGEYAPRDSVNGYCNDMRNLAALLQQGSKAVREVCPDAKIIIHLTTSTSITVETYKWFFSAMKDNNLDYDVIGASYYPYYNNKTIEEMVAGATTLTEIYDKDFIFMEIGFGWWPTLADGSIGQIADNKPYEDMTPEAQRAFMLQLAECIKAGSERILGYIYWDPIYIAAPNCGWKVGEKNVTGNSTLFDFDGKALPAWEAIVNN